MKDWITQGEGEDNQICRPCVLPFSLQWYADTLRESGDESRAKQLEDFADDSETTPLQVAETLDIIKTEVSDSLRERLFELDCQLQVNAASLQEGSEVQ